MGIDGLSAIAPPRSMADPEAFKAQRDEKAYKEFEALFIKQLLKEMRKTVPDGGLFEKSSEMDTYEEMLDGAFAQAMADSGQFGIAKQIEEQVRLQEEQRAQSAALPSDGAPGPLKS